MAHVVAEKVSRTFVGVPQGSPLDRDRHWSIRPHKKPLPVPGLSSVDSSGFGHGQGLGLRQGSRWPWRLLWHSALA